MESNDIFSEFDAEIDSVPNWPEWLRGAARNEYAHSGLTAVQAAEFLREFVQRLRDAVRPQNAPRASALVPDFGQQPGLVSLDLAHNLAETRHDRLETLYSQARLLGLSAFAIDFAREQCRSGEHIVAIGGEAAITSAGRHLRWTELVKLRPESWTNVETWEGQFYTAGHRARDGEG